MLRNGQLINRTDRGSVKHSFVEMYKKEKMFEDTFSLLGRECLVLILGLFTMT
jgi:hypothetical protein